MIFIGPDFFWQGNASKKKYRLARWDLIYHPKDQGGLGIIDLEIQNKCLLSKWLFKLFNEDGIWQSLLRKKYLGSKTLSQVSAKPTDSHFWKGLLNVKHTFLSYTSYNIKDGSQISFWEDVWRGNRPFSERFPNLYHVVFNKHDTVEQVVSTNPLNLSFRRTLGGVKLTEYINLVAYLRDFNLADERDTISWKLHNNGQFSVRSMYQKLINQQVPFRHKYIWKLKIPLKIKIFLWYLLKGVLLTKDNLAKKNWDGSHKCYFCNCNETIQHLFFIVITPKFFGEWWQ